MSVKRNSITVIQSLRSVSTHKEVSSVRNSTDPQPKPHVQWASNLTVILRHVLVSAGY